MTLTSAGCPVSDTLYEKIADIEMQIEGEYDLVVLPKIVFDPPWTRDMISEDGQI